MLGTVAWCAWGDAGVCGIVGGEDASGDFKAPLRWLGAVRGNKVCWCLEDLGLRGVWGLVVRFGCSGAGFGCLGTRARCSRLVSWGCVGKEVLLCR
jgi:hypothetical protein